MKKKILLFTSITGLFYITLSSYSDGPANHGAGNRTGSPGSAGTCVASGCHSSAASTTVDAIDVVDKVTGGAVTSYVAGRTYSLTLHGQTATATNFGFQSVVLNGSNASTGTLKTGTTSNVAVRNISGTQIIEHSSKLPGTSGPHTTINYEWVAPAASAGPVTIYAILNGVNNDGTSGGDGVSATFSKVLTDKTSVNDVQNSISITASPNPVQNELKIDFKNAVNGTYNISAFDLNGKVVIEQQVNVNTALQEAIINTEKWSAGMYHIQIQKDGRREMIPIVKQ